MKHGHGVEQSGVYEVFAAKSGSMEGLGPVLHDDCVKLSLIKIPLLAHPGYDLNGRKLKTNPVVALECVLEDLAPSHCCFQSAQEDVNGGETRRISEAQR